jgi:hypothetical protein
MPQRKILLLLALAVTVAAPATASAAPTVTVTGDDGNPVTLNAAAPFGMRQMDVTVNAAVPAGDAGNFTIQVFAPDGVAVTPLSSCIDPEFTTSTRRFADYRGNGPYTVLLRYYAEADTDCNGAASERRFQYVINAGTAVTAPATRVLTRAPNSFVTNTHQLGVALNPGAFGYEIRYALGGVVGPDGAISGPSGEAFLNTANGLADFRFTKPGRYVIVARARRGDFFTPWSGAVAVNAIAPFDLERVTFPDARGPRYKLRGIVRERAARGSRVTLYIAKKWKGRKFRKIGRAKVNSKGRFTKRFRQRGYGKHRLRYTFKGNSLVAAGRVTQRVTIRKRFFFG